MFGRLVGTALATDALQMKCVCELVYWFVYVYDGQ